MVRKELSAILLATTALLGTPNIADCQSKNSASHGIIIAIRPLRALYVNRNDDIIGIGILSEGVYFSEMDIKVFKDGAEIFLNNKILEQYHTYLAHPEIAEIDWSKRPGYHYYMVDPKYLGFLKSLDTKPLQSSIKPIETPSLLTETPKLKSTESLENGVLYTTITGE